jgi:hypothetical protein
MRPDAQLQAWLDQEDDRISADIRQFGWAIQYVDAQPRPGTFHA